MNAILLFQRSQLGENIHPFIIAEIDAFCSKYENVYLICLNIECDDSIFNAYKNLHIITYSLDSVKHNYIALLHFFSIDGIKDIYISIKNNIFGFSYLKSSCEILLYGRKLAKLSNKIILSNPRKKWIVEGYWLAGTAYAAALIKKKHKSVFAFSRAHSSEIDLLRNPYCICQMKQFIYKYIDKIYFVSNWGMENFTKKILSKYCISNFDKCELTRLGTSKKDEVINPGSMDNIFRILTCSRAVPLKRLNLLADVLVNWNSTSKIEWCHIGTGSEIDKLVKMLENRKSNASYKFLGNLTNDAVHNYLIEKPVDLFVNVSKYEGLPISIMEAQSYGIPVLATDAGGTSELVNSSNGKLLSLDCDSYELSEAIHMLFVELKNKQKREEMKVNSYTTWLSLCCKQDNYFELFQKIKNELENKPREYNDKKML